jgi:endonuclease/exonuclease/phosphatase (EEP) superfamily protein YafD
LYYHVPATYYDIDESPKKYMLTRLASPFLLLLFLQLTACVSVGSRSQISSDAVTIANELQSCVSLSAENSAAHSKQVLHPDVQAGHVQDDESLDPDSIALLNWNIYKGNGENWQKDLSSFAKSHDLMTIQEAYMDDELSGLLQTNNVNWVMNTAFHLNGTATGVMTAANSNAAYSCGFQNIEPIIRLPKSTLVSYYNITGHDKKLLVANIHGINFTLGLTAYHEQLEQLFDSLQHHDGPMIVAGDFNSWSEGRMAEVMQIIDRLSLSSLDYPVNNKTHLFGNAIDHVFYRDLHLVSNQVWQVSSSDHNPISVTFRL